MTDKRQVKNIILPAATGLFTPLALVLGFSVILHGHLTPGGGFQGGVIVAAAVLLVFLGYGSDTTGKILRTETLKKHEAFAAICYVFLALLGLLAGLEFCTNIFFDNGPTGALISSGTIGLMNYAVGYKVLTGVSCLLLIMLGLLAAPGADEQTK